MSLDTEDDDAGGKHGASKGKHWDVISQSITMIKQKQDSVKILSGKRAHITRSLVSFSGLRDIQHYPSSGRKLRELYAKVALSDVDDSVYILYLGKTEERLRYPLISHGVMGQKTDHPENKKAAISIFGFFMLNPQRWLKMHVSAVSGYV